jgi:peptidyl-prolyl cis-trans isomerase C
MYSDQNKSIKMKRFVLRLRAIGVVWLTFGCLSVAGCHGNDQKPGQSLVRVNGDEITIHQLNDELGQVAASDKSGKILDGQRKQLLEALIDRQLLVGAALHDKLDRDPNIMQSIDRAKSQILAQAYLQSRIDGLSKPSQADVEAYYRDHPEFFVQRKLFELKQVAIANKDNNADLKAAIESAKTLDEVNAWLDAHKIENTKSQSIRSSADIPPQILSKMQGHNEPQVFALNEEGKTVFVSVAYLKDSPATLQMAEPDIMRFLTNQKNQETGETELKRLRSVAKLEYLKQPDEKM